MIASEFNRNHLLVVDDDPQIVRWVERVARTSGYEVSTSNGDDDGALNPELTLVLLDLNLGSRDGLQILERAKVKSDGPDIVLMSGVDKRLLSMASAAGRDLGFSTDKILHKPFDVDALRGVLEQHRRVNDDDLAGELAEAIRAGTIDAYFQPIIDLETGELNGAEALVRWSHPVLGAISPLRLIPLAEKAGLMGALTLAMLKKIIQCWNSLPESRKTLRFSLNVPAPSLADSDFVARFLAIVHEGNLPAHNLTIEITESNSLHEVPNSRLTLCRLRLLGFEVAIDDLGTGYSSFLALRDLPFSSVKIDRAFVTEIHCQPEQHIIADAMTRVAHKFGIKVVAEGIENRQSLDTLRAAGIDYGQGYFFSKPLPFDNFHAFASGFDPVCSR
jgi:EAL domain-containing protein (putative c-di-GMP-specific phosphodiesterase class I)